MKRRKKPEPLTHLYRGSPCVRSWSKYQATDKGWALCGIYDERNAARKARVSAEADLRATADPTLVDCSQCVRLMHPEACSHAKTRCGFCDAANELVPGGRKMPRSMCLPPPEAGKEGMTLLPDLKG